jgi:hypothetical protein
MLTLEVSRVPDFPFEYRNLGRHTREHRVVVADSQRRLNAMQVGGQSFQRKKKKVRRERKTVFDASGRREKSCLCCSAVIAWRGIHAFITVAVTSYMT